VTVKGHPFADGNKRIASLFLPLFLRADRMSLRTNARGADGLALPAARSRPEERRQMAGLVKGVLERAEAAG